MPTVATHAMRDAHFDQNKSFRLVLSYIKTTGSNVNRSEVKSIVNLRLMRFRRSGINWSLKIKAGGALPQAPP